MGRNTQSWQGTSRDAVELHDYCWCTWRIDRRSRWLRAVLRPLARRIRSRFYRPRWRDAASKLGNNCSSSSCDGQFVGQVADETHFVSSNPQVVTIESGVLKPLANGEATITATAAGATATAHVVVTEMEKSFAWSFRNHVESVFAKTGCNSGACHGALAGKNGFKLSLRGYDPEGDFTTLTRGAGDAWSPPIPAAACC